MIERICYHSDLAIRKTITFSVLYYLHKTKTVDKLINRTRGPRELKEYYITSTCHDKLCRLATTVNTKKCGLIGISWRKKIARTLRLKRSFERV